MQFAILIIENGYLWKNLNAIKSQLLQLLLHKIPVKIFDMEWNLEGPLPHQLFSPVDLEMRFSGMKKLIKNTVR